MKLRSRIAAVLGVLALVAGLGVATSVPASAITTRFDFSYEGGGLALFSCSAVGNVVQFGDSCNAQWDYQAEGSAGGDGTYYYLHPHGHDNVCMTASTTQFGVIKIENCVGASQQYWWNPHNSAGYYHLFNAYYPAFLTDPSNGTTPGPASLTYSCSYGINGCTFEQV